MLNFDGHDILNRDMIEAGKYLHPNIPKTKIFPCVYTNITGAPEVVCMEDDTDKYFPRQCSGSVCMCVDDHGVSNDELHHSIEHLYQCPG